MSRREKLRAVIGRGKFCFKEEYQHFQVAETRWFKMKPEQHQAHLRKVATASVNTSTKLTETGSSSSLTKDVSPLSLSLDVSSVSEGIAVPLPCLQGIWNKDTELLNTSRAVTSASGHPEEAKMVMSSSGQRPHLVLPCKGSRFKCDSDCLNFKSLGICSHTLVVAELNKSLQEFVTSFKRSKRKPSFSEVAVHGMAAGRGRKGSQAPRKRKQSQPITEQVDRIAPASSSAAGTASCRCPTSTSSAPGSSNTTSRPR